jgi:Na+/H+ antiporter NhaA
MKAVIAIGLCIVGSSVAAFFLFGIAFNYAGADLRLGLILVYLGLLVLCLVGSLLAPGRPLGISAATLLLPLLMLAYFGTRNFEYFIHAGILCGLGYGVSFYAGRGAAGSRR